MLDSLLLELEVFDSLLLELEMLDSLLLELEMLDSLLLELEMLNSLLLELELPGSQRGKLCGFLPFPLKQWSLLELLLSTLELLELSTQAGLLAFLGSPQPTVAETD
jgi:hypothetical protein